MVVEADESDGTATLYSPEIAVITNIEYDHMEHHACEESFVNVFRQFAKNAKSVVYCSEDKIATEICASLENATGYFLSKDFKIDGFNLPGRHNLLNASAVFAVAELLNLEKVQIARALGNVEAPLRRFEIISEKTESRLFPITRIIQPKSAVWFKAQKSKNRSELSPFFSRIDIRELWHLAQISRRRSTESTSFFWFLFMPLLKSRLKAERR